jgi:hypothetical protein
MRRHVLSALAVAAAFFSAIEDMPLAPGLTEAPAASTVFDKADGRIVQLVATGPATPDQVLRFYADALPQLGWRKADTHTWRREAESLTIEVRPKGRDAELRISITPTKANR